MGDSGEREDRSARAGLLTHDELFAHDREREQRRDLRERGQRASEDGKGGAEQQPEAAAQADAIERPVAPPLIVKIRHRVTSRYRPKERPAETENAEHPAEGRRRLGVR